MLNSESEVNTITPAYTAKLDLQVQKTNVGAQKIVEFSIEIYNMVINAFQVLNKIGRSQFFQEIFLLANISMEVVLKIPFLIFSNVNV